MKKILRDGQGTFEYTCLMDIQQRTISAEEDLNY